MSQRQRDVREFADWKLSDWLDYRQLMIGLVADRDDQIAQMQARLDGTQAPTTRNGHKDCTVPEYLAEGTILPGCDPQPVIAEGDGE
jgi:hypothetical protein